MICGLRATHRLKTESNHCVVVWQLYYCTSQITFVAAQLSYYRTFATVGIRFLPSQNCPIAQEARPIIVKLTWKVFERPNFGRCFGGYRDGVKLLFRLSVSPERLVIVNDSIIYPLYEKDKTLETLENLECDISGIMMRKRGQTENLESYFLSISKNAFNHKGFKKFWDNYRPTSDKQKTIKRGERGFSIAMSQCGLSIKSLYKRETFETCLKQLTDAELFQTIKYQAVLYPNIARQGQHLLLSHNIA